VYLFSVFLKTALYMLKLRPARSPDDHTYFRHGASAGKGLRSMSQAFAQTTRTYGRCGGQSPY